MRKRARFTRFLFQHITAIINNISIRIHTSTMSIMRMDIFINTLYIDHHMPQTRRSPATLEHATRFQSLLSPRRLQEIKTENPLHFKVCKTECRRCWTTKANRFLHCSTSTIRKQEQAACSRSCCRGFYSRRRRRIHRAKPGEHKKMRARVLQRREGEAHRRVEEAQGCEH